MVRLKSEVSVKLRVSHYAHDVRELTDRLVVADGRAEGMRKTREATADDVLAMIIPGYSQSVPSAQIVSSLR